MEKLGKRLKKVKKAPVEPTFIDNSKQDVDIQVDLFQEDLDDDLIKTLSGANTKAIAPLKEKERKVVEFKSRVLELVEIFVQHTKNPQIFIEKLHPFIQLLQDFRNPQKLQFVQRVCNVVTTILQKVDITEHIDNVSECAQQVIQLIHKCHDQKTNAKLVVILDLLFKSLHKLEQPQARQVISQTLVKGLVLMRKNSNLKAQVLRKLIFAYPFVLVKVFPKLAELSQITEKFSKGRNDYVNLLLTIIENEKIKTKIVGKQKLMEAFKGLFDNVLENIEKQQNKKVAIFRKVFIMASQLKKSASEEQMKEVTDKLSEFTSEDKNLLHIVQKYKDQ